MPSCSKSRNPRGVEITFDETSHRYWSVIDGKEIDYISGTTFAHKFFPGFDPDGTITAACARKRGLTVEQLKAEWKKEGNESCLYGTKTHERMEDWINGTPFRGSPNNLKEKLTLENADKLAKMIKVKFKNFKAETIVFDEKLRIAGTIDLLANSMKDGKLWIIDYKTNKEILMENKYNNFGLHCIKHLPAINSVEYGIQLNLYEYLLKSAGYIDKNSEVRKMLFHITTSGCKPILIPDYQKEIKDMVNFYENGGFNK